MTDKKGIYCIRYSALPEDGTYREMEWGRFPGKWSVASKEVGSSLWDFSEYIDEDGYNTILLHFGIFSFKKELPLDKIKFMSPARLILKRREKETKLELSRREVINENPGNNFPAEEYE